MRPTLAVAMCQFPDLVLRGTVRLRSKRKRQKMVDGMLGSDAVFSVADGVTPVGVITGDDDLIPLFCLRTWLVRGTSSGCVREPLVRV